MIKKTITFEDLDGNPVTEDFYFNLTKAEIAEMELSKDGGLSAYLQEIVKSTKGSEIIATFKNIITSSIGRRSEDGKRFIKSQEITDEFLQSEAYSELFMELVTDAAGSAAFVEGIMPKSLLENIPKNLAPEAEPEVKKVKEPKDMTKAELLAAFQAKTEELKGA